MKGFFFILLGECELYLDLLDGLPDEKAEELQQRYANKAMGLEEEK